MQAQKDHNWLIFALGHLIILQQLEEESRTEAEASEKKQLEAHKLLEALGGLRQGASGTADDSNCNTNYNNNSSSSSSPSNKNNSDSNSDNNNSANTHIAPPLPPPPPQATEEASLPNGHL